LKAYCLPQAGHMMLVMGVNCKTNELQWYSAMRGESCRRAIAQHFLPGRGVQQGSEAVSHFLLKGQPRAGHFHCGSIE
jgi:hypothetical protein